ncbi:hypothetical protein E3Q20_00437 [Wallemia mellicola]|nr:hypothetical protein E3Q20_00437 [Wallemia mellicola]
MRKNNATTMAAKHKTFDDSEAAPTNAEIDAFTPAIKPELQYEDSESSDDDDDDDQPVEAVSTKLSSIDHLRLSREHEERRKTEQRKLKNQRQTLRKQLKEEKRRRDDAIEASTSLATQQSDESSDEELPDRLPTDILEEAARYVPKSQRKDEEEVSQPRKKSRKSRKEQIIGNKLIKLTQSSISTNRADGLLGDGTGKTLKKYNKDMLNRKRRDIRKPAHITHAKSRSGFRPALQFAKSEQE